MDAKQLVSGDLCPLPPPHTLPHAAYYLARYTAEGGPTPLTRPLDETNDETALSRGLHPQSPDADALLLLAQTAMTSFPDKITGPIGGRVPKRWLKKKKKKKKEKSPACCWQAHANPECRRRNYLAKSQEGLRPSPPSCPPSLYMQMNRNGKRRK